MPETAAQGLALLVVGLLLLLGLIDSARVASGEMEWRLARNSGMTQWNRGEWKSFSGWWLLSRLSVLPQATLLAA